jgi:urease
LKALGKHLDIPAGTAVRFEPGDIKTVDLCSFGGKKIAKGGNSLSSQLEKGISEDIFRKFTHVPEPDALAVYVDKDLGHEDYISMYGPTVGDRIRLGDTSLWIQIERDSVGHTTISVCSLD